MNSSQLHIWRKRQKLSSWKAAANALRLPYWRMLRFKNGKEKIPLAIELACISFECRQFTETVSGRVVSYFEVLRYTWFCERIIKVIELPRGDVRREELNLTLLLGLVAVIAGDSDTSASVILRRILARVEETEARAARVADPSSSNGDSYVDVIQGTRPVFPE